MKPIYFALLIVILYSCSQPSIIVDGIEYEHLEIRDSICQQNGDFVHFEISIDYPMGNSLVAHNLRRAMIEDVDMWMFKRNSWADIRTYDIPNGEIIDSLRCWIGAGPSGRSNRFLSINILPSGVPGIASYEIIIDSPRHYINCNSVETRTGVLLGSDMIPDIDSLDTYIIKAIWNQKNEILEKGIPYDESGEMLQNIKYFSGVSYIENGCFMFYYGNESIGKEYYLSIPIMEVAEYISPTCVPLQVFLMRSKVVPSK